MGVGAEQPKTWGGASQKLGRIDRVWGGREADRPGVDRLWGGSTGIHFMVPWYHIMAPFYGMCVPGIKSATSAANIIRLAYINC